MSFRAVVALSITYGAFTAEIFRNVIIIKILSVVSISIPIAITELLFPNVKGSPWLSKKQLSIFMMILFSNAFIGPLFGMKITTAGMIACYLGIFGLAFKAYKWSNEKDSNIPDKEIKHWIIILAGFLLMMGFIIGMWVMPSLQVPWILTFIFLSGLPWIGIKWFERFGVNQWTEQQQWSGIVGLLIPWLLLDVVSEIDNSNRPDDTSGMIMTAILFFAFLVIIRVMIQKRQEPQESR